MLGVFKRGGGDTERSAAERGTRHSRGWGELRKYLASREGLRVLDFGPTLPANINYLTELGHSVYMANAVSDAAAPEWQRPKAEGEGKSGEMEFDVERFSASNLGFSGREFDVVLLWDTANYLPPELVAPFFRRMHDVLQPGGKLLAFFHAKKEGPETGFSRYQLTSDDDLIVMRSAKFPILGLYQNRQIEHLFDGFDDLRFFLGNDNMREVYATR